MTRHLARAAVFVALLFAISAVSACVLYTHPRRGHSARYVRDSHHDHGHHYGHPGRHDNGHHYGESKGHHDHGHGHGHDHDD